MTREDHVTGGEGDDCIWMSGCIVQKIVDLVHGVLHWGFLLVVYGSKGDEHRAVNCTAVVVENPEYFLY